MNIKTIREIKRLLLKCNFINDEHAIFSMLEKFISFLKGETDFVYTNLAALYTEVLNTEKDIEHFECSENCTEEEREDCSICSIHRLLFLLNDFRLILRRVLERVYEAQKGGINEI